MFDIGWAEFLIIGIVGLIVIGPKDLPEVFRTIGRFTAKLRSMSRDFQRAMDTAATESGVKDVANDLKNMTSAKNLGLDKVKEAASKFEKWDPLKPKPAGPVRPSVMTAPTMNPMMGQMMGTPLPETIAALPPVVAPMGPATQALADKVAAKKAIVKEAAEKLRAVADAPVAAPIVPPVPVKSPGRVRKAAAKADFAAAAVPIPATTAAPVSAPKSAPRPRPEKPKGDA